MNSTSRRMLVAAVGLLPPFAGALLLGAQAQEQRQIRVRERAPLLIGRDEAMPQPAEVPENVLARWIHGRCDELENFAKRGQFESKLKIRVDKIAKRYELSEAQQKKLLLAGRGDIKHFYGSLDAIRSRLKAGGAGSDAEAQAATQDIEGLDRRFRGDPFARGSIFAKSIASTLTREQFARYEKTERELILNRYRWTIQWVMRTWVETLNLSALQQRRLQTLCEQETRPPQRFGADDYAGILLQLSRLPEEKLKPIFTEAQWTTVKVQIAEAKKQETQLKKDGYLPDDDVAGAPAGATGTHDTQPESKRG
jgi:hypothetical protein